VLTIEFVLAQSSGELGTSREGCGGLLPRVWERLRKIPTFVRIDQMVD
jgi:hypothetical protein